MSKRPRTCSSSHAMTLPCNDERSAARCAAQPSKGGDSIPRRPPGNWQGSSGPVSPPNVGTSEERTTGWPKPSTPHPSLLRPGMSRWWPIPTNPPAPDSDLLRLIRQHDSMSSADVAAALSLSRRAALNHLQRLMDDGLVEPTAPPRSRDRQYRAVPPAEERRPSSG
ncbi:winged helix-turn-helix transcriptional regulator [Luteococcus sp. H138]|uniref:winged helix-turn-helix transcriptional regulator n=1 Tax=unclassified Luteococcus TaxID=2639923 RepID=UPI00406CE1C1